MRGNSDDIERVIEIYGNDVLRICRYYLHNKQDAEDAFQEVFIKVLRKRSGFMGKSDFRTWLTRVAINTCKDFLKSRSLRNETDLGAGSLDEADRHTATYDHYDELYGIIVTLPQDYKDVILLKYYFGYTLREMAKILRITESAVNSRLRRAKIYLKKILTEKGGSDNEYSH